MKNKIYLKTISELRSAIKEVSKTAEQYFATTNDNFLLMVLLFNAILYQRLSNSFIMQTSQLDEQINSKPAIQDSTNIKRLRLSLDSDYTFNQFISKLVAISRIYNEIANLTGVSTTEYPIVLVKVESGSSLQDILGYRKIIELMEKLIVDTTEYFHRNFTTEGKISTISTKVETIETLLKLRQKLRASGINTDNMDESINNSSLIVAEELNKLLIGAPNVKLNELMLSIGDDFKDKYLEASDPYLLDSGLNDYD